MSNIRPVSHFTPTPGTPRAAIGTFPFDHPTIRQADIDLLMMAKGYHMVACRTAKRRGEPKPKFDREYYVGLAMDEMFY